MTPRVSAYADTTTSNEEQALPPPVNNDISLEMALDFILAFSANAAIFLTAVEIVKMSVALYENGMQQLGGLNA